MADSPTVPVPGPDPDREALAAARGLTDALNGVTGELASLRAYGKTNRHIITGLVISLCLDLLITIGFGWNTVRVNDAQNATHASEVQQCRLANAARRQDVAIWNRLFLVPPSVAAKATAAQKAEIADLKRLVKAKDAPRDCQAAYKAK